MGAIQKQFNFGDNVRIPMAPLNRPAIRLDSKCSKLYHNVAVKGVLASVEDPETMETLPVHGQR